ncbi:acyl-CoA dehydrogenase family protein [Gordonia sp. 'Campus']|uniref:acyl-CoA dehydrogenase family protein n=1 Tax=Gordonia sp. 'Campus' TaxID=2915824 RepID=UPI001EE4C98C|nr:acyl-CoA dehydrogenase family protein [Gordonia sp. 'Campus']
MITPRSEPGSADPAARGAVLRAAALRIADEVLFPAAADVDRTGVVPASHWQALSEAGLYGIAAPAEAGGPGLDFAEVTEILEVLLSGCLATAFTWLQHHGVVISLARSANTHLRDELLGATVRGELRAGVAYAGVVPTPPRMRASREDGRWVLSGDAPFVSGWGVVDLLQISARDTDTDDVVSAVLPMPELVDPRGNIRVTPIDLSAASGTSTVSLHIDELPVSDAQVVSRVGLADFFAGQNVGIRLNGTLPLGLVRRCTAVLDTTGHSREARRLRERADVARLALDDALPDAAALLAARADAAGLALDAAAALVAASGGRALVRGADSERLFREASFVLVAASRPELKDALLQRFSDSR